MTDARPLYELVVDIIDLVAPVPDGDESMLTLEQAIALPELAGHFTPVMLRHVIAEGLLVAEFHGRQAFVTRNAIREWRAACRAPARARASGSVPNAQTTAASTAPRPSSSSTGESRSPRATALERLSRLKRPSSGT